MKPLQQKTFQLLRKLPSFLLAAVLFCQAALSTALLAPIKARASYEEHLESTKQQSSAAQRKTPANPASFLPILEEKGRPASVPSLPKKGSASASEALRLLVPQGFICSGLLGRQDNAPVSWGRKDSWHDVMQRLASATSTHILVSWQEKTITLSPAKAGPVPTAPAAEAPAGKASGAASQKCEEVRPGAANAISLAPEPQKKTDAGAASAGTVPAAESTKPQAAGSAVTIPLSQPSKTDAPATSPAAGTNAASTGTAKTPAAAANAASPPAAAAAKQADPVKEALLEAGRQKTQKPSSQPAAASASQAAVLAAGTSASTAGSIAGNPKDKAVAVPQSTPAQPKAQSSGSKAEPLPKTRARSNQPVQTVQPAQTSQPQAQAPGAPAEPAEYWQIGPGSLRSQLEAWAARKGIAVLWKPDADLELETGAHYTGTFAQAVRALFEGLRKTGTAFRVHLYHGNAVLTVEDN